MFNLNQTIILISFLLFFTSFNYGKTSSINYNNNKNNNNGSNEINCDEVTCDLNLKCKKDASLKHLNSSCCLICVCDKCPELNYEICSTGFKPIKQIKLEDECCEIIACISNSENEDLILNIDKFNNQHHQNIDDDFKFLPNSNDYVLNNESIGDIDEDLDSDESYNYGYENETSQINENPMCSNYKCLDEKYKYFKSNHNCPRDSHLVETNMIERQCCLVEKACECNDCPLKSEMIEWCKLAGNNFEAIVVQKAENIPGKCCDVHICHSPNYTCNLNGIFYPHNSKWKLNTCTDCECDMGQIKCNKISCPVLDCEVKQSLNFECCPVCTNECLGENDKIYKHNETWKEDNDDCIECKCLDGQKSCITESCIPNDCVDPIKTPGVCCKACPNKESNTHRYLKYPPHCKSKVLTKCNVTCMYGFKLDGNRCPTCICSDQPLDKCSFECDKDIAYMPLNDRLCDCQKKCDQLNNCDLKCLNGYEKNVEGCDICKCKEKKHDCTNENSDQIWSNGCHQCFCKDGHEYCSLISCKKLECSNPIYLKDNCCPSCPDEHEKITKSTNITACFSPKNGNIYLENDSWQLDKCTNCTCKNGMVLCDSHECPIVACSNPIFNDKDCCPYCEKEDKINEKKPKKYWSCFDSNDEIRLHDSLWKENDCLNCVCNNGERKCYDMQKYCTKLDCLNTIMRKGQCCPYCLDSIHSPYILSLLNNLTILKTINQNHKTHNAISSYILYFLVLIVIVLVSIVIVLLLKVLGSNNSFDSNQKSNMKLNQHFEYNNSKLKKSKSKNNNHNNNYSLGNVIIPLSETEANLVSLEANRELSPLLLNCDNNNTSNNNSSNNNNNSSDVSHSENLDTNNSTELLSELFNSDENSKSTLISNKTDDTVLRSSINPSQNRIICYL